MKIRWSLKLTGIISLLTLAGHSIAQTTPSLPGSVIPSQVGRAIKNQQPTEAEAVQPPVLTQQAPVPKGLTEQAKKIKFQLNGIILSGNTVFSTAQLQMLYARDLHKTITIAELFSIVQNITNFYRNNGYILSRAILPPQHVKGGVVKIRIIEGYLGSVSVTGHPYGSTKIVKQFGERIKACPPLQISHMEKYLYLANEIPGTQVKAVLAPSKSQTGAADLTLVTDNKPVMGYLSYDNYGTRYIGPQQMTANITGNSFLVSGDSGQITFVKTPKGRELTYIDANYNLPLNAEGVRWLIGGTRVETNPLFVLQPTDISGVNENYYTMLYFPIIRTRSESLTYRAGFNYLDSDVTTFGFPLYTDHLRSVDVGGTYNVADRWNGTNLISADFRQGLPIMGYSSDTNINTATTSRPGGRGAYSKIAMTLSRLQAIKGPWSIYGIFQGQWAFNPLLAAEQFTFGGPILGRGYDVAELIGDKGTAGSLELRYDYAPEKFMIQNLQFYVFYDAGMIWNFEFIGGVPTKLSGTSTGVGVRFFMTQYVSGNLMWTQVLTKQVAAEELIGDGKRPRVFFSIVASL